MERPDGSVDELVAPTAGRRERDVRADRPAGRLHGHPARGPGRLGRPVRRVVARAVGGTASARAGERRGQPRRARPSGRPRPATPTRFAVDLLDVDESRDRARRPGEADRARDEPGGPGAGPAARRRRAPERPRRAVDPDRARRPRPAHDRVAGLRARHARAPPPRRRGPPRPVAAVAGGAPDGHRVRRPAARSCCCRRSSRSSIALHLSSRRRLGKGRRRAALAVRVLLLAALVGALAGLQLVLPVDRLAVVFVVDLSDSVGTPGPRGGARLPPRSRWPRSRTRTWRGSSRSARDALVERLPSDLAEIDRIASTPVRDATDIGAALRLAGALFPDDAQKRIVLLSDGNDTTGSGQSEAALAAARGIQVETRPRPASPAATRSSSSGSTAPSTARLGESIDVSRRRHLDRSPSPPPCGCSSTASWPAPSPWTSRRARPGSRSTSRPRTPGFLRFRMVVEAARDTFNQNDRAEANTIVKGEPRVLVVKGDEDVAARAGHRARDRAPGRSTRSSPRRLPSDLAGLADYDSIVLVDVPRLRLTDAAMAALQVYVRDLGRGLVMVGGPRSYGAGGYTDTPLEETLPVDMGVRDREKQPDVALVVVIDKSGSMDACHCNSFNGGDGRRVRDRGRAQGRHRQGGDPAGGLGPERAGRARRRGVRRLGALGHPDGAARRPPGPPGGDRGHQPQRPDEHLRRPRPGGEVARGREGDPAPHHPAHRRLVDAAASTTRSSSR